MTSSPSLLRRVLRVVGIATALCTLPAAAQVLFFDHASAPASAAASAPSISLLPTAAANCGDGLVYDDGGFESQVSVAGLASLDAVMAVEVPAGRQRLSRLCVCWTRHGGPSQIGFDLVLYRGDGPEGGPGDLLLGIGNLRAQNVPLFPQTAFYSIDLSQLPITLPAGKVYLGSSWSSNDLADLALCGDNTTPTPRRAYFSADLGSTWEDLGGQFPDLRALGVRAETAVGSGSGTCTANATTLCLAAGRFQVRVSFRTSQGSQGSGTVVPFGSSDSGMFWFFNANNWEMLVKVIDGCALNSHFWVFYAALTDVELDLEVTDTASGAVKHFRNALGHLANTVADTNAFTCSGS